MWRILLLVVSGAMVSFIGLDCGNLNSPVSTIDTLYINSRDTIYRFDTVSVKNSHDTVFRFDTVYSKDTVFVETLLVNRSVYIDTAGNSYSKNLAFKGRVGDLPFEKDSAAVAYSIRVSNFIGFGHYDTVVCWSPIILIGTWQIIDTVDSGIITYGHYIIGTGVPIDSSWIMDLTLRGSNTNAYYQTLNGDRARHSLHTSSIWITGTLRSWLPAEMNPSLNTEYYQCVLMSPSK